MQLISFNYSMPYSEDQRNLAINIKTSLRAPGQRPLRTISIPDKRLPLPDLLPDIESSLFYFMISNPAMITDQQYFPKVR
ncbi:uncharacterized protein RAG0_14012 [Rhynchosporium agropyri]|uniref:Uncharacterized protein n=1 Tax=Rhynchosporium agropyri TaxID=914238 RepID=A0A1E1LF38_9HELO|nr:uncharacterized protein RAG0_14012 [Rhynchosporium agropyri]